MQVVIQHDLGVRVDLGQVMALTNVLSVTMTSVQCVCRNPGVVTVADQYSISLHTTLKFWPECLH